MIKHFSVSSIILLVILSTFALAAGSSSGNAQNSNTCETDNDCILGPSSDCCGEVNKCYYSNDDVPSAPPTCSPLLGCPSINGPTSCSCVNSICIGNTGSTTTTCEDKATLRERIKCRFENKDVAIREAIAAVEEACRDSDKRDACIQLYKRSSACYDETNPVAKKRCFLKEAGININAGGTFRAAPDETKRNYVVLLLYDLQERIEVKAEEGKITSDQVASLVTKIVEIKKLILSGAKRSDITLKIQEFKKEFREVMSGVSA